MPSTAKNTVIGVVVVGPAPFTVNVSTSLKSAIASSLAKFGIAPPQAQGVGGFPGKQSPLQVAVSLALRCTDPVARSPEA